MAQRTTVMLIDDLDGSGADESLEFGLDGVSYEIDLTDVHAAALRDALAPYIAYARRTGRVPATSARRQGTSAPTSSWTAAGAHEQNQAIRDWAARHGHPLSTRGRIPAAVSEAFHRGDPAALPATGASSSTTNTPVDPSPPSEEPTPALPAATGDSPASRLGPDGLTNDEREQFRAWATEEGIEVKARGRLSKDLIGNYRSVHARR